MLVIFTPNSLRSISLLYYLLVFLSKNLWGPFLHPDFHGDLFARNGLTAALVFPSSPVPADCVLSSNSATRSISRQSKIKEH